MVDNTCVMWGWDVSAGGRAAEVAPVAVAICCQSQLLGRAGLLGGPVTALPRTLAQGHDPFLVQVPCPGHLHKEGVMSWMPWSQALAEL